MRGFKKWNLKQSTDILRNNHRLYAYVDEERKRSWRAALEMVLKEREARGDNHLKCVFDMIEEELGNETEKD